MNDEHDVRAPLDRRQFFKTAGAGLTAAAVMTPRETILAQEAAKKSALDRIASNSYPIRPLFKSRMSAAAGAPATRREAARSDSGDDTEALAKNPNAAGPLAVATAAAAARANLPNPSADEREVRRNHDAGLPAVHQRHVSWCDPDGSLLGAVRRCH